MMHSILAVLAIGVLVGLGVGVAAGRLPGIGAFAAATVLGLIAVVLRRNHRDRKELRRGLVPEPVDRVAGPDGPLREGP